MSKTLAVVLAAGKGTRMKVDGPKVLCQVCGRPMIEYVLDALSEAGVDESLVVVGYGGEDVKAALSGRADFSFVEQTEQLGTGHAVMVCKERLAEHDGPVVVVAGDSPMLKAKSLRKLLEEFSRSRPACLLGTAHKEVPTGLGRIVRDENGGFRGIVEEKDADESQRRITEVNMSTYVFNCRDLLFALDNIDRDNTQREYYLTDCPGVLLTAGRDVRALPVLEPVESLSVNTPKELAAVEAVIRG